MKATRIERRVMQPTTVWAQGTLASRKLLGTIIGSKESSFSAALCRFFATSVLLAEEVMVQGICWGPFCAVLEAADFLKRARSAEIPLMSQKTEANMPSVA